MEDSGPDLVGALLEQRYRVDALLARGGMSAVYRGLDTRLDRPVAIKVMDPRFAADQQFVERFEREARSAAKIHHPNVVAVHDQGLDGDHVFLVMELVDGGTLRDLLTERGALGVPLAVSVMEPVLAALAAAHRAGLVHRDVKPENVLIGTNGVVKVADFGLVRAVASVRTTSSSVILGTVAYLSPEQVTTGTATARGDVYSAGILVYEMLTGQPPYVGDNALSIAYRHVNDDVPAPRPAVEAIPPDLEALVLRATRRDPASRPLDGGAFLIELERARAAASIPRVPVPVPHHHLIDLTVPVSAEDRARALGLDAPPDAGNAFGELGRDDAEATIVPVGTATTVRRIPPGFQAVGPQGTRAMLRTDLDQRARPEYAPPVLTAPPPLPRSAPPSPPYGMAPPHTGGVSLPRSHPPSRSNRIVLWSLLGALLLVVTGTATWWFAAGRWTEVPRLDGKDRAGAERSLTDADLKPDVQPVRDNQIQAGVVIRTEPAGGRRALRGDPVRLIVSLGRPVVPNVRPGSTVAEAEQAIQAAELTPQTDDGKKQFDDTVPTGAVVGLDPKPGSQLNIGTTVNIVVSRGPKPKPVPDLHGKSRDEAFQVLRDNGFEPVEGPAEFAGDVDGGHVVRTDPPANSQPNPDAGKQVKVILSNAVTLPDLGQHPAGEAKSTLEGLGLRVEIQQFSGNPDSRVFAQAPAAGSRVEPGAKVQLFAFP
ncbi:MAG: protein kinase domain-containing protein [Labedaea sp.]